MTEIHYPRYRHNGKESVLIHNYEEDQKLLDGPNGPWFDTPSAAWKWHAEQAGNSATVPEKPKAMAAAVPIPKEEPKPSGGGEKLHAFSDEIFAFKCPACKTLHNVSIKKWKWNGSTTKPTFTPSVNVNYNDASKRCHFFVEEGKIRYCSDCFHSMKGQKVDLPDWE